MRMWMAWTVSLLAGAILYSALLVVAMSDVPIMIEGRTGERLGVWRWLHIPVAFGLLTLFAPRPWGVPLGIVVATFVFAAAMEWGGLWETGPNYEGPGPGLAVFGMAWFAFWGSTAGALLRTLWNLWRRSRAESRTTP